MSSENSNGNSLGLSIFGLKRFIYIAAVVILALVGWQAIRVVRSSKLVIVTNNPKNSISVIRASDNGEGEENETEEKEEQGSAVRPQELKSGTAISLKPGKYNVTIKGAEGIVTKSVEVVANKTSRYTVSINAKKLLVEPVAHVNSRYFTVSSSQLIYVDQDTKKLYKIDSGNNLTLVNGLAFSTVYWADASYGVGQDSSGVLYIIENGISTPLALPSSDQNLAIKTYAIAPNRDIYIAVGTKIYRGTASGGLKHVYTAKQPANIMIASNDAAAIFYLPGNRETKTSPTSVTLLDKANKTTTKSIEAYDSSWSPSGKYLATTNDSGSFIFDKSLKQVAVVPNNNFNDPAWLDDNKLLYGINNQLWEYSLNSGEAKVIAAMGQNQAIVTVLPSPDKTFIYLSAQKDSGSNNYLSLYRVGLKNQSVSQSHAIIDAKLPWLVDGCFLSLVNFTTPTIEVVQNNPYDGCIDVAKRFVGSQTVNIDDFSYQLTNVLPSTPDVN